MEIIDILLNLQFHKNKRRQTKIFMNKIDSMRMIIYQVNSRVVEIIQVITDISTYRYIVRYVWV